MTTSARAAEAAEPQDGSFTLTLRLQDGYRFLAAFDDEALPALAMDEPPPLGGGTAPNASRVLAAAIGDCLSASALYCLRRARVQVHDMRTTVHGTLARNEAGRLRIGSISVQIEPVVDADDRPRMRRCLELFEDFCVVTQSVRAGIDVDVAVKPAERAQPA